MAGRLRQARDRASLARRRFSEAVEQVRSIACRRGRPTPALTSRESSRPSFSLQGRPQRVLHALEAELRAADRAADAEAEWHHQLRAAVGVPQSFSADGGSRNGDGDSDVPLADVQAALRACRAARQDEEALFSSAAPPPPPPGSEAAAASADRAADAARRRVLCIAAFSPAPLRRRIVSACALAPGGAAAQAPASQTPQRGSSAAEAASLFSRIVATDVLAATRGAEASESRAAALAFPITADCLCTAVGPVRCMEGAFRAYVHGHADVLLALAMLRGGNVTGPARAFCDALGPARCNLVMKSDELEPGVVDAGRAVAGHEAVSVLWQVRQRGERAR